MVTQEKFDLLVDIVQDISEVMKQLNQRIDSLQAVVEQQQEKISDLQTNVNDLISWSNG